MPRLVPFAALLCLATTAVVGQDWRLVDALRQPLATAAYDSARQRTVSVGDRGETREWNGVVWLHRPLPALPGQPAAMTFDAQRNVTVALLAGTTAMRTFEFDGSAWSERATAVAPSVRLGCGFAFDALRGRVVLFGGGLFVPNDETWEWDGTTWLLRTPTTRPPRRLGTAMAFDFARGRCVLFGGNDPTVGAFGIAYNDTWQWDGVTWTQAAPFTVPAVRAGHALAYDIARQVTVMFGGGAVAQTWEFDGATWLQRSGVMPAQRTNGALAYDSVRGRTILFGGSLNAPHQDLWELDASGWSQRIAPNAPGQRTGHAIAHAATRDRTVLFGGYAAGATLADTWQWDGGSWSAAQPTISPPPRSRHTMWSDGNDVFVFGGLDATFALRTDTWRFDGITWHAVPTATAPPARQFTAIAFEPSTGGGLLFGGSTSGGTLLGDTWRLGVNGWTQLAPAATPGPRASPAIAADLARQRIVLWGGVGPGSTPLSDTWEWNGTTWLLRTPAHHPVATGMHTMTWEPSLGLTVLLARTSQHDARVTVWLWDGVDWSPLATPSSIPSSYEMIAVAANGAVRCHDNDHLVELSGVPPRVERYGSACGAPAPRLDADAWPRPGAADFAVSFAAHTSNAPIVAVFATDPLALPLAGCTLLVTPGGPAAAVIANASGAAALPMPLPALPGLIGARLVAQAWSLCPAGVCATAGLAITIGR